MDKFLHFKSIDFAQEASFINWVNETNVADINQWNKWIADHPEKRVIIDESKLLVKSIRFKEENITPNLEDKIWKNIDAATRNQSSKIGTVAPSGSLRLLKKWAPLAAAAIIALLVYVNVPTGVDYDTTLQTAISEKSKELLPDGSIIDINAKSEIAYSNAKWESNREVKLEGEAYFSVKKGSKFTVVTDNGSVEVLGTSFNVYSRGDLFTVECETGKVRVVSDGKEVILKPKEGMRLNLTENEASMFEVSTMRSAWRKGSFNYKDVALREVFDDIERHFGTKIKSTDLLDKQLYTGEFSATNIDSVLYRVCWPLNLDVNKSDEEYKVSSSKK